jgi:hypothetical protein
MAGLTPAIVDTPQTKRDLIKLQHSLPFGRTICNAFLQVFLEPSMVNTQGFLARPFCFPRIFSIKP